MLQNQRDEISTLKNQVKSLIVKVDGVESDADGEVEESLITYDGQNGKTALELLKDNYTVETQEFSGVGEFVLSIDDIEAEDGQNFWAFYIDGEMAMEGASTYETKDGEKIEWRLDEIQ